MGFSYYAYDSVTKGNLVGQLNLTGVRFGAVLNGAGSFEASFKPTDPKLANSETDWIAATDPGKSVIVVDFNGIAFPYLIQSRAGGWDDSGDYNVSLSGTGLFGLFAGQMQATDYSAPPYSGISGNSSTMPYWNAANLSSSGTPYGWDPMLIGAQLIIDCFSVPYAAPFGGEWDIYLNGYSIQTDGAAAYLASGLNTPKSAYVSESFPFSSLQSLDSLLRQLTQLGYGVGFDIWAGGTYLGGSGSSLFMGIELSYPRWGRTYAQDSLSIDLSRARSYTMPEDASSMGNTIYETGGNQDIVASQNAYPLQAGYPNWAKAINRAQLNSGNVTQLLTAMGLNDLVIYSWPPVAPTVTVDVADPIVGLGSCKEGDDILLTLPAKAQDGQPYDPRFPAGLEVEFQVTGWEAQVADEGESTLTYTFGSPPGTAAPQSPI